MIDRDQYRSVRIGLFKTKGEKMTLVARVHLRSPFRVGRLPFLAKVYKFAFNKTRTLHSAARARESARGSIVHRPRKTAFNIFWKLWPVGVKGKFFLDVGDGNSSTELTFNARNTQFHALYLDRYRHGYEPEVATFLDIVLPQCRVFVDIGANWGYFTLFALSAPSFAGHVVAVDPNSLAFKDLQQLVSLAGLKHRVSCWHGALAENNGEAFLKIGDGIHTGETRLTNEPTSLRAPKLRLDGLLWELKMKDEVDVLKIDTEGSEFNVLMGTTTTIKKTHPIIIFESTIEDFGNPPQILAPFWFLADQGYEFFAPSWRVKHQSGSFLFPDNRALFQFEGADQELTLTLFSPGQRLMFPQKINCIAMTAERRRDLVARNVFSPLET